MDIDQRLGALTINLELLTRDVHDLQNIVREVSADVRELGGYIKVIAAGSARLSLDVERHNERLDDHEQRLNNLGA
jgi:archaellum component FlaC